MSIQGERTAGALALGAPFKAWVLPTSLLLLASWLRTPAPAANDYFPATEARITLTVDGTPEDIILTGPTFVTRTDPADFNSNGLEDSQTQIHQMRLQGHSTFGPVIMTLNPDLPTIGCVEEGVNLIPFQIEPPASAQFDVLVHIDLPAQGIYAQNALIDPIALDATLSDIPPGEGDAFGFVGQIPLVSRNPADPLPVPVTLGAVLHTPRPQGQDLPFVEHDVFPRMLGQLLLEVPDAPGVETPDPGLPPLEGVYLTADSVFGTYTQGDLELVLRDTRLKPLPDPPPVIAQMGPDEQQSFEASMEGTAVLTDSSRGISEVEVAFRLSGPVTTIARGKTTGESTGSWDTELASMDLTGELSDPSFGTLSLTLVESPVMSSSGRTTVRSDGGRFHIDSFFDIFTEVSIDGGPVIPAAGGRRVTAYGNGVETEVPSLPPEEGEYRSSKLMHAEFPGTSSAITLQDARYRPGTVLDRSIDGDDEIQTFLCDLLTLVTYDDAQGYSITTPVTLTGPVETRISDALGNTTGSFQTEMVSMDLIGIADLPGRGLTVLYVREDAAQASTGATTIRELPDGAYHIDSFFDVFTEISIDGGLRWISANDPGRIDLHEEPERSLMFGAGETQVDVYFDGPNEGDALDHDGDGLDEVLSQVIDMRLDGYVGDVGGFQLAARVEEAYPSLGEIEERVNPVSGRLDVMSAFAPDGTADSFFDLWPAVSIEVDGAWQSLFSPSATRVESIVRSKPPEDGERFVFAPAQPVTLLTASGDATRYRIVREVIDTTVAHQDSLPETAFCFELIGGPVGSTPYLFTASGPTDISLYFEGPSAPLGFDDDLNGLDEVVAEIRSMDLTDDFIDVHIRPASKAPWVPSLGLVEEATNLSRGQLDLNPFLPGTAAGCSFNVFIEFDLAGNIFHNKAALRLVTRPAGRWPFSRAALVIPPDDPPELYDENGQPTGVYLLSGEYATGQSEAEWTGFSGSSWNETGNWHPMFLPAVCDSLHFPGTASASVVDVETQRSVKSARFSGGVAYQLDGGSLALWSGEIQTTGTATHIVNSDIQLGNDGMFVQDAGSGLTLAGEISGSVDLTKSGDGVLILAGANTYSGDTTAERGLLLLSNSVGSATGSGHLTLQSGATLGGNGSLSGGVTASAGSTISPGASTGSLDLGAGVVLEGTYRFEVGGSASDFISATTLNLLGGTLDIGVLPEGLQQPVYRIASYGALAGGNPFGAVLDLPPGYVVQYSFDDGTSPNNIALVGTSPYNAWAISHGLFFSNGVFGADADADGGPNGYELATGTVPTNADSIARLTISVTNGNPVVHFTRNTNAVDVTIHLRRALDMMGTWSGIATNRAGVWTPSFVASESGTGNPVNVEILDNTLTSPSGAYRLLITRP